MKNFIKSVAGIKTIISVLLIILAIIMACVVSAAACVITVVFIIGIWLDNILDVILKKVS
jgi:hypothetical protein